jgi:hypothetical protein
MAQKWVAIPEPNRVMNRSLNVRILVGMGLEVFKKTGIDPLQ